MQFYALEKLINLSDGYRKLFKIDQYNLLLIQVGNELHLIEANCPHQGHPLSDAELCSTTIQCSLHNYRFDLETGAVIQQTKEPCRALRRFEVIYRDTDVGVILDG